MPQSSYEDQLVCRKEEREAFRIAEPPDHTPRFLSMIWLLMMVVLHRDCCSLAHQLYVENGSERFYPPAVPSVLENSRDAQVMLHQSMVRLDVGSESVYNPLAGYYYCTEHSAHLLSQSPTRSGARRS